MLYRGMESCKSIAHVLSSYLITKNMALMRKDITELYSFIDDFLSNLYRAGKAEVNTSTPKKKSIL